MAARKRLALAPKTRERIQVSMLLNLLEKHAVGEIELDAQRIQSIKILLGKTLPDLKAVEHTGSIAQITHEQWLDTLKDE